LLELQRRLQVELAGRSFLPASLVDELRAAFGLSMQDLLRPLLALAQERACAPISEFRVAAVLGAENQQGACDLFLGANFETAGGTLNQTVHAEQAAIHNALVHGAGRARFIAVTAMPCGHCRQFMCELDRALELQVIVLPSRSDSLAREFTLAELLPEPFGPRDLDLAASLLSRPSKALCCSLGEGLTDIDPRLLNHSYCPYSRTPSARCLELQDGRALAACAIESAAFNPSLSAELAFRSLLAVHGLDSSALAQQEDLPQ